MNLSAYFAIIFGSIFVNNFVLARFLGLCPFVGVSKKTDEAVGMGMAVIFVMTLASAATWCLYHFVLLPGEETGQNILSFLIGNKVSLVPILKNVSYILVIATLVQLVEITMRKTSPGLYRALGIYLPLITTNCAVMGVALLNTTDAPRDFNFLEATVQGFSAGVGFLLAVLLMSAIRERLALSAVPESLRGLPVAFICAALMALSFLGFAGILGTG